MSSKRRIRKKMCLRKVPYETESEARKGASKSYDLFKTTLHPYHCKFCGRYHLGHPPRMVREQMVKRGVVV